MTDYHAAQKPLFGIALKVISTLAFVGMATVVKIASDRFPIGEMTFFRSFFALIPVFAWVAARGDFPRVFYTKNLLGHLGRSIAGTIGMFCGFAALSYMPIADATAIGYAAPLLTVIFAFLFLGEHVRFYRWSAVVVGLTGVLIILSDYFGPRPSTHSETVALGAIFAMIGAVGSALAAVQVRTLTRFEPAGTIVVYFSLFVSAASLITLPFGWVMPNLPEFGLLVLAGILGGIGQVLMTQSYRYADASTIAPFEYVSMIWVLVVSFFIFGTWPSLTVLGGTIVVIAAGLYVIYRERQLGIERRKAKEAQTPTNPLS